MAEISYPNREHANADKAARRRALAALAHLTDEAGNFRQRIEGGYAIDGDDARRIERLASDITRHVSVIGILSEVREWHALDAADGCGEES